MKLRALAMTALCLPYVARAQDKPLRIAEMWEITGLDPATDDGTLEKEKSLIVETLVKGNPDFSISPNLAASWERTGDLTWLFHLRPGVAFHDGAPLNAEAVIASLTRARDLNTTVKSYTRIASMQARDDLTVEITTAVPYPALPASLEYASTGIVAPSSTRTANGKIDRPIGTGPYRLADWQPAAQTFRVVRNDSYWGPRPAIPAMEFRAVPDPTTRSLEMQKGSIDFTAEVPYGDLDALAAKGFQVSRHVTARDYVLTFGSLVGTPFADLRVRKAISAAIDRDGIAEYVLFGMGRAAAGPFEPRMTFAAKELKPPAYDPDLARTLLAEAGYAPGPGGTMAKDGRPLAFTIYTYPQRPGLVPIAGAIQGQLRKVGIAVEVKVTAFGSIAAQMKPTDARLAAFATTMFPDPDFFLRAMYSSAGDNNSWGYRNDQLDAALQAALMAKTPGDRKVEYDRVQTLAMQDEPIILVDYYGVNVVMRPGVSNYTFNPSAHDYILDPNMTMAE